MSSKAAKPCCSTLIDHPAAHTFCLDSAHAGFTVTHFHSVSEMAVVLYGPNQQLLLILVALAQGLHNHWSSQFTLNSTGKNPSAFPIPIHLISTAPTSQQELTLLHSFLSFSNKS